MVSFMPPMPTRLARVLVVLALAAGCLLAAAAVASGDDRSNAETILGVLEHDSAHKALTADLVRRSRAALERATRMQSAGDGAHARIAEGLALAWAQTAQDLVRAADAEQRAASTRLDANDAGAHAERERALVEEGIARTGRLRAELESVEKQAKETPARTNAVGASIDAGAPVAKPRRNPGVQPGVLPEGGAP